MKYTMTITKLAAAAVAAGAIGVAGAGIAAAEVAAEGAAAAAPTTQPIGSQGKLVEGNVVQGWTVTGLKQSTDVIPYQAAGTLWEVTATDKAIEGGATPFVSNFNARAKDGQTYRALFGVATPEGVNPSTLAPGQETSGKIYFDVTGAQPDSVVYNAGGHDLLVWTPPAPQPTQSSPSTRGGQTASTPAASPASVETKPEGTIVEPSTVTEGAPLPASAGTVPGAPLPAGSSGTPLAETVPVAEGTPAAAGVPAAVPAAEGTPATAGVPAAVPAAEGAPVPAGSQGTPLPAGVQGEPAPVPAAAQEVPAQSDAPVSHGTPASVAPTTTVVVPPPS